MPQHAWCVCQANLFGKNTECLNKFIAAWATQKAGMSAGKAMCTSPAMRIPTQLTPPMWLCGSPFMQPGWLSGGTAPKKACLLCSPNKGLSLVLDS